MNGDPFWPGNKPESGEMNDVGQLQTRLTARWECGRVTVLDWGTCSLHILIIQSLGTKLPIQIGKEKS